MNTGLVFSFEGDFLNYFKLSRQSWWVSILYLGGASLRNFEHLT